MNSFKKITLTASIMVLIEKNSQKIALYSPENRNRSVRKKKKKKEKKEKK